MDNQNKQIKGHEADLKKKDTRKTFHYTPVDGKPMNVKAKDIHEANEKFKTMKDEKKD